MKLREVVVLGFTPIPQMVIKHDLVEVPLICSRLKMKPSRGREENRMQLASVLLRPRTTVIGNGGSGHLTAGVANGIGFCLK